MRLLRVTIWVGCGGGDDEYSNIDINHSNSNKFYLNNIYNIKMILFSVVRL